jgi:hypothetical protein
MDPFSSPAIYSAIQTEQVALQSVLARHLHEAPYAISLASPDPAQGLGSRLNIIA